jgi:hypothetical protein
MGALTGTVDRDGSTKDPAAGRWPHGGGSTGTRPVRGRPGHSGVPGHAGVEVHVLETRDAVKIYNELVERVPVGGLFHSTC